MKKIFSIISVFCLMNCTFSTGALVPYSANTAATYSDSRQTQSASANQFWSIIDPIRRTVLSYALRIPTICSPAKADPKPALPSFTVEPIMVRRSDGTPVVVIDRANFAMWSICIGGTWNFQTALSINEKYLNKAFNSQRVFIPDAWDLTTCYLIETVALAIGRPFTKLELRKSATDLNNLIVTEANFDWLPKAISCDTDHEEGAIQISIKYNPHIFRPGVNVNLLYLSIKLEQDQNAAHHIPLNTLKHKAKKTRSTTELLNIITDSGFKVIENLIELGITNSKGGQMLEHNIQKFFPDGSSELQVLHCAPGVGSYRDTCLRTNKLRLNGTLNDFATIISNFPQISSSDHLNFDGLRQFLGNCEYLEETRTLLGNTDVVRSEKKDNPSGVNILMVS